MILKRIFNNSGEFIEKGYDPYRSHREKYGEIHDYLFDEDGGLNYGMDQLLADFIKENNCSWYSAIVKLYWAEQMGMNTKGSYPAVYMWR